MGRIVRFAALQFAQARGRLEAGAVRHAAGTIVRCNARVDAGGSVSLEDIARAVAVRFGRDFAGSIGAATCTLDWTNYAQAGEGAFGLAAQELALTGRQERASAVGKTT